MAKSADEKVSQFTKVGSQDTVDKVTAPFGIIKDFEDLENFLFGLNAPGAMEAFKRLSRVRSMCAKCGMHVFVDWR